MVNARVVPIVALACAFITAGVVAAWRAPVGLLPRPERPFDGYGRPGTRIEGRSYPRRATGADGVRTSIEVPPMRLVSQSSSTDEYLYAVVPPQRVVGVSDVAYLERISNVSGLANRYRPVVALDPERVLRTEPDLVMTPAEARFDVPGLLRAAGLRVYRTQTMFATLDEVEDQIRLIGYLTGEDARADAEATRFRNVVRLAAARKPDGARRPRVMGFGGVYSYGSETLFNDILSALGAENVAATHGFVGYDRVTDEHIVRWNPEWIVAGADRGRVARTRARLMAHPAIAATTAARRGQVIVLENHVFLPLSPFATQLVEALADALYGGTS
jgi:iron complex transport system substrate-binding protein